MPSDNVLALLALLFLWLFERLQRRHRARAEERAAEEEGRRSVAVDGWKGVRVIEQLPSRPLAFSATVRVPDGTDGDGPSRSVDLAELTCTCPDHRKHRAELPEEAIGRICDHVSRALRKTGVTSSFDELLQAIVEEGATRRVYYEVSLRSDRKIAVGHDPGSDQVDVIAPVRPRDRKSGTAGGPYRRYGYSLSSGRWLVDARPPGAVEIGELIGHLPLER